jgi:hypothetical protein
MWWTLLGDVVRSFKLELPYCIPFLKEMHLPLLKAETKLMESRQWKNPNYHCLALCMLSISVSDPQIFLPDPRIMDGIMEGQIITDPDLDLDPTWHFCGHWKKICFQNFKILTFLEFFFLKFLWIFDKIIRIRIFLINPDPRVCSLELRSGSNWSNWLRIHRIQIRNPVINWWKLRVGEVGWEGGTQIGTVYEWDWSLFPLRIQRSNCEPNAPLKGKYACVSYVSSSVADPHPPDPHVFGLPGSGSISQRYGFGYGFGSFYHDAKK